MVFIPAPFDLFVFYTNRVTPRPRSGRHIRHILEIYFRVPLLITSDRVRCPPSTVKNTDLHLRGCCDCHIFIYIWIYAARQICPILDSVYVGHGQFIKALELERCFWYTILPLSLFFPVLLVPRRPSMTMLEVSNTEKYQDTPPTICISLDEESTIYPHPSSGALITPTPTVEGHSQPEILLCSGGHAYPEGGFKAYMTVLGAFIALFCTFGQMNAFGTFQAWYASHQLRHMPASTISWIGSLQLWIFFFSVSILSRCLLIFCF